MFKRIAAIVGIFASTCVAWMILGTSIFFRTDNLGPVLSSRVGSTWGTEQGQKPPSVNYFTQEVKTVEVEEKGKKVQKTEITKVAHDIALNSSRIGADFQIEYRQKGLLWFSTYKVAFEGTYTFQNPTEQEQRITIQLPLPAKEAVYDGLEIELDSKPLKIAIGGTEASAEARVGARATGTIKAGYRSQGMDSWSYQLSGGEGVARINDFRLAMNTDFDGLDSPGCELFAAGGEFAIRDGGCGFLAADLPGAVFVCVFL